MTQPEVLRSSLYASSALIHKLMALALHRALPFRPIFVGSVTPFTLVGRGWLCSVLVFCCSWFLTISIFTTMVSSQNIKAVHPTIPKSFPKGKSYVLPAYLQGAFTQLPAKPRRAPRPLTIATSSSTPFKATYLVGTFCGLFKFSISLSSV